MGSVAVAVLVGAALLASPHAAAASAAPAPVDLAIDVEGRVAFTGDSQATLGVAGLLHDHELGQGILGLRAVLDQAHVAVWEIEHQTLATSGSLGQRHLNTSSEPRLVDAWTASGPLRLGGQQPEFSLRLLPSPAGPASSWPLELAGSWSVSPPVDPRDLLRGAVPDRGLEDTFPRKAGHLRADVDGLRTECACRLVAFGYTVALDGQEVRTGWSATSPAVGGALGGLPGPAQVHTRTARVLVVDGPMQVEATESPPEVALFVASLDASADGDLTAVDVAALDEREGPGLAGEADLLQLVGRFALHADYGESGSRWSMAGEATYVGVDAHGVSGTPPWVPAAAAGGAVAALLGLLGYALHALRPAWAAWIPGLNVADPLGNPQRSTILATVAVHPGIDQSELATQVGLARGTVRHHLRILLRADLVAERPLANRRTYTLNDSSYEFPASPGAPSAGQTLAALRHPIRGALLGCLVARGEADYGKLRVDLELMGHDLPADKASYHLGLLEEAGIVQRRRAGRMVLWSSRIDPQLIQAEQRHRFLKLSQLSAVYDEVPAAPVPESAVLAALRAKGWKGTGRELVMRLQLLTAAGYVVRTGGQVQRRQPVA